MPRKTKSRSHNPETEREEFADGSAIVTYRNGTMVILESNLAKLTALSVREGQSVSYNEPAPKPKKTG
jgi:hypothetical protein